MIDKSLLYFDVVMVRPGDLPPIAAPTLPDGHRYRMYAPGAAADWADIQSAVDEFDTREQALAHFEREFLPHEAELARRMVFIEDADGRAVADATAWWGDDAQMGRFAMLHWVATRPDAQGRGLGRAVTEIALSLFPDVGPQGDIWLTTQTWSHVAIGLYLSLGFRAHRRIRLAGHDNGYFGAASVLQQVMPPRVFAQFTETAIG